MVSVVVIITVAVDTDGRREVLGLAVAPSEAEPFWMASPCGVSPGVACATSSW